MTVRAGVGPDQLPPQRGLAVAGAYLVTMRSTRQTFLIRQPVLNQLSSGSYVLSVELPPRTVGSSIRKMVNVKS